MSIYLLQSTIKNLGSAIVAGFLSVSVLVGVCAVDLAHAEDIDISRIVSIGGDVTEIIYALGHDDKIVAVDSTSQFPESALKDKKSVGYMRQLSSEGVLSLQPSVIIASETSGPPAVIEALKASSIPYIEIEDGSSAEGVISKINRIAQVLGAQAQRDKLLQSFGDSMAVLDESRKKVGEPIKALFVLMARGGRAMVGGGDTNANEIFRLAGAENAAQGLNGYKLISSESLIEMAPDAIIVMNRGDGQGAHKSILGLKGLGLTPAGKEKRYIVMDGLYLIGFGPRMPRAALDLMHALYPQSAKMQQPASQ